MSTSKEIREYIATQISSLPNIGIVHAKNKLPKSAKDFKEFFEYDGRLQAWTITRSAIGPRDQSGNFDRFSETYTITTFLGFNDSLDSETLFEVSIDKVIDLLKDDTSLGGHVLNMTTIHSPEIAIMKIGEIFCHHAEIVIEVDRVS
jgi:hypothetical protein